MSLPCLKMRDRNLYFILTLTFHCFLIMSFWSVLFSIVQKQLPSLPTPNKEDSTPSDWGEFAVWARSPSQFTALLCSGLHTNQFTLRTRHQLKLKLGSHRPLNLLSSTISWVIPLLFERELPHVCLFITYALQPMLCPLHVECCIRKMLTVQSKSDE